MKHPIVTIYKAPQSSEYPIGQARLLECVDAHTIRPLWRVRMLDTKEERVWAVKYSTTKSTRTRRNG